MKQLISPVFALCVIFIYGGCASTVPGTGNKTGISAPESVVRLHAEAEAGSISAQIELAFIYYDGKEVPLDRSKAAKWFRRAADQRHILAQNMLGAMYLNGDGVSQIAAEAVKWYRLSGEQGDVFAQIKLGTMYHYGQDVVQDKREATRWYRKAAAQGDVFSQNSLLALEQHEKGEN